MSATAFKTQLTDQTVDAVMAELRAAGELLIELRAPAGFMRDALGLTCAEIRDAVDGLSSTQVNLPQDVAEDVIALGFEIANDDLAADGREDQPHITVKYGLVTKDPAAVRRLLAQQGPLRATLGVTSLFEHPEQDVLKLNVESPDLVALNARLCSYLEHLDAYPDYQPHVTVAYLRPGRGERYVNDATLLGRELMFTELVFSVKKADGSYEQTVIALEGQPGARAAEFNPDQPRDEQGRWTDSVASWVARANPWHANTSSPTTGLGPYLNSGGDPRHDRHAIAREAGFSDETIQAGDNLLHWHGAVTLGPDVENPGDTEIVARLRAGDEVGRYLAHHANLEARMLDAWMKARGVDDFPVYRAGSHGMKDIESWTTDARGASPTIITDPNNRWTPNLKSSYRALRAEGWSVLGGAVKLMGASGEDELTFIRSSLLKNIRAAEFNPDQPRDHLGRWTDDPSAHWIASVGVVGANQVFLTPTARWSELAKIQKAKNKQTEIVKRVSNLKNEQRDVHEEELHQLEQIERVLKADIRTKDAERGRNKFAYMKQGARLVAAAHIQRQGSSAILKAAGILVKDLSRFFAKQLFDMTVQWGLQKVLLGGYHFLRGAASKDALSEAATAHERPVVDLLTHGFSAAKDALSLADLERALGDLRAAEFNPDQPRDEQGRWTPVAMYHGTTVDALKSILKEGLRGSKAGKIWTMSKPGVVYMSHDLETAKSWAESAWMEAAEEARVFDEKIETGPAILELALPKDLFPALQPDENLVDPSLSHELHGNVRPEWISRVWVNKNEEWAPTHDWVPLSIDKLKAAEGSRRVYVVVAIPHGDLRTAEFNPDQPRDDHGRWTDTDDHDAVVQGVNNAITNGWVKVYHGTSSKALAAIKTEGLIPDKSPGADAWLKEQEDFVDMVRALRGDPPRMRSKDDIISMKVGDRKASVYVTDSYRSAKQFADAAAEVTGSTPVVIALDVPKSKLVNDEKSNAEMRAFRHLGPIPNEWIKGRAMPGTSKLKPLAAHADDVVRLYVVLLVDEDDDESSTEESLRNGERARAAGGALGDAEAAGGHAAGGGLRGTERGLSAAPPESSGGVRAERTSRGLAGFDPTQERDERGRWTDDGLSQADAETLIREARAANLAKYGMAHAIDMTNMTVADRLAIMRAYQTAPEFYFSHDRYRGNTEYGRRFDAFRKEAVEKNWSHARILREAYERELISDTKSEKFGYTSSGASLWQNELTGLDERGRDEFERGFIDMLAGTRLSNNSALYSTQADELVQAGWTVPELERFADRVAAAGGVGSRDYDEATRTYSPLDYLARQLGFFSQDLESFKTAAFGDWSIAHGTQGAHIVKVLSEKAFPHTDGISSFYRPAWTDERRPDRPPLERLYSETRGLANILKLKEETEAFYEKKLKTNDLRSKPLEVMRGVGGHILAYTPAGAESWTRDPHTVPRFGDMMSVREGGEDIYTALKTTVTHDDVLWSYQSAAGQHGWPDEKSLKGKKEYVILGRAIKSVEADRRYAK